MMSTPTSRISIILLLALMVVSPFGFGRERPVATPSISSTVTLVPETFLREYDPVTVFFPQDVGPAGGGPLNNPGEWLIITPAHPGEYRWKDARTLQFLPTVPWPALERYTITAAGSRFTLVTLMSAPRTITPANGSRDLPPVRDITLAFPIPVGADKLAAMLSFDIRPLPGTRGGEALHLTSRDFAVKPLERAALDQPVRYQVTFQKPLPLGTATTMTLQLSLDPAIKGSLARYTFSTRPPFSLTGIGAGELLFPVAEKGSEFSREQALDCGTASEPLFLEFSSALGTTSLEAVKQLVHFEPAVKNFRFEPAGRRLRLFFDVERDRLYRLRVSAAPIRDDSGRSLVSPGTTAVYFYYRQASPYLKWLASHGILERFGPQVFPMEGRGSAQVDLRIYKLNPLDRNFWPFPGDPVTINESQRPPGPGEEPAEATNLAKHIQLLDTPLVSRIVPLPMAAGNRSRFGVSLKAHLARIAGVDQPGHYLVGYRELGSQPLRRYVRIQVTDLSLSTVEEESAVTFVVTSLRKAKPVAGAEVRVEGFAGKTWRTALSGVTDVDGRSRYEHTRQLNMDIRRISVRHADDVLVLDAATPPPSFMDNHWYGSYGNWLEWLNYQPRHNKEERVDKAHILTERPVYRPEEAVHIKGYVRSRQQGRILPADTGDTLPLVVNGPGDKTWTYQVTLTPAGSFYHLFKESDLPTGTYTASIRDKNMAILAQVSFRKESYRIPRFEVNLSAPDRAPLDAPFKVTLTADYYAGGRVVGEEVTWRVTQFPFRQTLGNWPGFLFSSDERFSTGRPFQAESARVTRDVTDDNGSATLELDPTIEENAQPRRYVIEATVRGADEQTVTNTKTVVTLPPFVLGLKLPRFLKNTTRIHPEVLVVGYDDKPLAGQDFHLRLYQRQWHSYLRESDFTTGKAKYVTDVVDDLIFENDYTSGLDPLGIDLEAKESGVYVVEISARDRLGRLQRVQADLYIAGKTPVAWEKPKASVFETSLDKHTYNPGDTAELLIQSPYQDARALIVVEGPRANTYHWVDVSGGQGLFRLPITGDMTPRVPVHILLLRGRVPGTGETLLQGHEDRGKPATMGNTTWIKVNPRDNRLVVTLDHPDRTLPGKTVPFTIHLADPAGAPLDGEVTLWLVDRAVLALGREQPLDPLPSFIDEVTSMLRLRDSRNEVVGNLPDEEITGGGAGEREAGLFGRVTIRRNFQPVPYFNPTIQVIGGTATVEIRMPDNLTDFAVRAVATDGLARFGYHKSVISIRLPVIVQSALPRFVRPGDSFVAGGIGRVVEGAGGPGQAHIKVEGLEVTGSATRPVSWVKDQAEQLFFPLSLPLKTDRTDVSISLAVERTADGATDAFEVKLPVRPDRPVRRLERFTELHKDQPATFPQPDITPRPGTMQQLGAITTRPALLKMLAGLNYLAGYPYGCTEQRISQVMPDLTLGDLMTAIGRGPLREKELKHNMDELFKWLEMTQQSNGLYSYWPGVAADGQVSLTAYVVQFLVTARQQGYSFDDQRLTRAVRALEESLRSDYTHFIDGASFIERAEALSALSRAGRFDDAYAHDLLARALSMDLYSEAQILQVFEAQGPAYQDAIDRLSADLWKSLVFVQRDGKEVYHGLQYRQKSWGGLVLSSEIKTLGGVLQALYRRAPEDHRIQYLVNDMVRRGEGNGWGSTNANASALLALGQVLGTPPPSPSNIPVGVTFGDQAQVLDTSGQVISRITSHSIIPGRLSVAADSTAQPLTAWLVTEFTPDERGDRVRQQSEGFVVDREMLVYANPNQPPARHPVTADSPETLTVGTLVEEHIRVINAEDRHYVAVQIPFAAGFEPLNPNLATAPPEARPAGVLTMKPSYAQYGDDQIIFFYDTLPKGTYDFYFRLRASVAGDYTHPAARAEMMYSQSIQGHSDGTRVVVQPRPDTDRKN